MLPLHEVDVFQFAHLNSPSVYGALMFLFSDHRKHIWVLTGMDRLLLGPAGILNHSGTSAVGDATASLNFEAR